MGREPWHGPFCQGLRGLGLPGGSREAVPSPTQIHFPGKKIKNLPAREVQRAPHTLHPAGRQLCSTGSPPVTSTALLTPALVPTSISSFLHHSTHRMLSVSLLFPPELSPPKQQPGAGGGSFCAVQGRWGQQQLCGLVVVGQPWVCSGSQRNGCF